MEGSARILDFVSVMHCDGAWFRFHVTSQENPDNSYLVDLEENDFTGKCGCRHFECRLQPRINAGEKGRMVQCKHIIAAKEAWFDLVARKLQQSLQRS